MNILSYMYIVGKFGINFSKVSDLVDIYYWKIFFIFFYVK